MLQHLRRIGNGLRWRLRCQWAVWRSVAVSREALRSGPGRRILLVCYGNIFRSPYAAVLLGELLHDRTRVRSGGFHPVDGRPSPEIARRLAAERGLDLAGHRSATLTPADLAWADLVVVMDRHNWQAVRMLGRRDGIVWLGALDGRGEIDDPYGRGDAETRACFERLGRCTEQLAESLLRHSPSAPR